MKMRDSPPAEAVVVMDRFVSASSAQDATKSLEQLVDAFQSSKNADPDRKETDIIWRPSWIFEHEEIAEHLVWLLQHGTLKANESPCEEGAHLICELYQYLIKSSDVLMKPRPGVFLESLLDILDNTEQPVYLRVLALRLLDDVSKAHKSISVNQWLQAPNGLYRIADLLAIDVENSPMEEAIRNQALIVAKSLAREAPMAKVFLFAEVDCKLLDLCWKEGGLTKGSPIVIDALELIQEVLKHADASLQDLVWQRPNVAPRLMQLLDLRGGDEFLHPNQKKLQPSKISEADDDLDSILASGDEKSKEEGQVEDALISHLLPSEANVVKLVLNILRLLLETDSVREKVWKQQTGLCSIIWELALVSNPSNPPVCALPNSSLQQEAMNLVADKFNDPATMDRLSGLDRLLYLVCTGGGISESFQEKLGISQSALAILRQSLSESRIHDILMRTLAPPPTEDETTSPTGPTVVKKLWNTVQENLNAEASDERTLFLSGALGGLGLMLCDEQSREIMFKVTPISLDQITGSLTEENESVIKCSLLRFLCEWTYECPFIAHNLLSTTASTHFAAMAATPSDYQSLAHLLLGLSMEYLTKEEECGGWTRNGILQIILKIGISKYTSSLEGLKSKPNQKMPWIVSEMEYKNWKKFCRVAVLTVRKRVVEELAAGSGYSDDDSDDKNGASGSGIHSQPSSQGMKPLQRLISQQAKEIEEMTLRLETAEGRVSSQENQLNTWRRRMESTPTELDHMLNEFTSKNSDLEDKVKFLESEIERKKSEKDKEIEVARNKLLAAETESYRLQSREQELRDDLEMTEQEMKALSEAYSSLEEEFRRQQNEDGAGAQSAGYSQQLEGQSSHEQNGSVSTEVATFRSENARLKNDAQKADEWMSMAVEKMNDMGAANLELEKQVSQLKGAIKESRDVADNIDVDNQTGAQQRQNLEEELEKERALRLAAEGRLSHFEDLQFKLESEYSKSQQLQHRIDDTEQALVKYEYKESMMQAEQLRVVELEKRVREAEEATKESARRLEFEREAKIALETRLNGHDNDELEELRAEYDKMIATKSTEIETTRQSVVREEEGEHGDRVSDANLVDSSQIVDEIRQSSQEEIYRLESVIRELKGRLGSDLGAYKVEDVLARDEEIEELRKANESAQEWMGKAVEHDNRNSNRIQALSDQNTSLIEQLEEERKRHTSENTTKSPSTGKEIEKLQASAFLKKQFAELEAELDDLKRERDANQGLLDELGIAMDDVAVMQQQLLEYKAIKAELERKLSGNALSGENEDLRSSNEELQKNLSDYEEWVQIAQTKIGDIMAAKNEIEGRLLDASIEVESLKKENDSLKATKAEPRDNECIIQQVHEDMEKLKSSNDQLQVDNNDKERQYEDLHSKHKTLLQSFTDIEQELKASSTARNGLEKDLWEQRQLSSSQATEIHELKAANVRFVDSHDESNVRTGHDHDNDPPISNVESSDAPHVHTEESVGTNRQDQIVRIDDTVEELKRTKMELAVTKEGLSSEENISREWEERALQLESELATVEKQMQEQESEAVSVIAKWEQNVIELEEKCTVLEENLKKLSQNKEPVNAMNDESDSEHFKQKENNASFQKKIDYLETSLTGGSNSQIDSEVQDSDTVAQLREALKTAQDTLAKDEEVVQQWEERTAELEIKIESLETNLRESEVEANEVIGQWQSSCAEAESKYAIMEEELNNLKAADQTQDESSDKKNIDEANSMQALETLAQKEEELRQCKAEIESSNQSLQNLKDEVLALNHEINSINEELENQKSQAMNSIEHWKKELDASHQQKSQSETDLEEAKSKIANLEDLCSTFANDEQVASQWEERNRELSESVAVLEDQLKEQEQEALDAVDQWQSACSALEMKCADLELVVEANHETISTSQCSIGELRSSNESFRSQIEKLKAAPIILESSLTENLASAKAEISRLLEEQEVKRAKWSDELQGEKERNVEARDEIEKLSSSLEEINTDSTDTLRQWTVRYEEVNIALKDAQQQLEEQEIEANEAISVWEMKTDELEKDLDIAEDQLLNLKDILGDNSVGTRGNLVAAVENLLHENSNLNSQLENSRSGVEESISQVRRLESESKALMESLSSKEKQIQKMKLKYDDIAHQLTSKSEDKLEEERDRLIGVVAQLEEELREANSMLQACVTDGSIDKASEFAANAIRDDVYSMRNQLNEYQQRLADEQAAREVADLEIDRLRDDIAALLSLSDHEKSPTNMKKLTTKSIERLQKLEHIEIDDLRKSLFRALEELEFARSTESKSNETVSKFRLQISIYEQEIIAAKSEVNFLSEAMEELRQTESSKRASLEYRIASLENENEVVRKYQANELENLRNEIAQIAMEKDLIIYQLKETEKTNASLVLATSNEENRQNHLKPDAHSECVKLRIENAHLLTIAAEEKGKAERRLREQLSAQVASSELDIILEHELRLSAETALQVLKEEVGELRYSKHPEKIQEMSDNSTEKELQDLRSCVEDLREQNIRLKATINEESSKGKETIDRLTDECRTAQAKAFKFDRDTRTELAVQSEISKMRISTMALPGDKIFAYEDLVLDTRDGPSGRDGSMIVKSAEAFDLIRKQEKEIQEERMMYSETLHEHEDLLALVAQQDLEKSCLREALIQVAGDDAADDALKRAEEFAIVRYGNAVQVST